MTSIAPFIIVEDLGNGPVRKFDWTDTILAQADGIRSTPVRRMLRNHLDCTDGASVYLAVGRLETFRDKLVLWRDFVTAAPVNTSHGKLTTADIPSFIRAIAILDPIIAAARGETISVVEAA